MIKARTALAAALRDAALWGTVDARLREEGRIELRTQRLEPVMYRVRADRLEDGVFTREQGVDRRHENVAADYLAAWFPPDVTEPIRLHVAAKRYLCAVDGGYFDTLSPASVRSLELQGGVFDGAAAMAFSAQPYAADAASLRRWDDLAKDPDVAPPGLEHYRAIVAQCLKAT